MYYDLNIPWPVRIQSGSLPPTSKNAPSKKQIAKGKQKAVGDQIARPTGANALGSEEKAELERCVKMAIKLGYSTIAFNVLIPPKTVDISTIASLNPCYGHQPVFPELDTRNGETSKQGGTKSVLQLSRVTVVLDGDAVTGSGGKGNGAIFTSGNASATAGYNLISALPLDTAAFTHICLNLSSPSPTGVDIITLDLASSPRLPFQLKRSMVLKAIADGAVFEVCYGTAMRSSAASIPNLPPVKSDARRNVIAGARELIRVTNGKGVILSSEVRRCLEMRGPLDLCNFGTILGLKPDQAKNTVSNNARLTVLRGHANRGSYRGVISNPQVIISTVETVVSTDAKRPVDTDDTTTQTKKKRQRSQSPAKT